MERKPISQLLHKTVGRGIAMIREILARSRLPHYQQDYFVVIRPAYVSQFAFADKQKIAGYYGQIRDPEAAKRFGTSDLNEFSYWAWRSCGIAGLQMVLQTELDSSSGKTTMALIREGLDLGGYNIQTDTGWYHSILARLANNYGIEAGLRKFIPSSEIALSVTTGNYALASIDSPSGGHLLLIYGVRLSASGNLEGFYLHDPNDYHTHGEAQFIPKQHFDRLTTRRVILFKSIRNPHGI